MRIVEEISLTKEELTVLNAWLRLPISARLVLRAKIVLLAADGLTNRKIARQLQITRERVSLWRRRFLEGRLAGIEKEARAKRKPRIDKAVILLKMKEPPVNAPRWTIRSLAKELGVPSATLQRAWKAYGLDSDPE